MKKAKKALALLLCTVMVFSSLYVGGSLGFFKDAITAFAAQSTNNVLDEPQNENSPRLELSFNKNWRFHLNEANGAYEQDFDDSSWRKVNLPHDFSIEQNFTTSGTETESGSLPGGTGWYRKTFTMPASFIGRKVILNFDGAYNHTEVFVNGRKAAINVYGYNSFSVDISDDLVFDGVTKNVVSVKVVAEHPSSRWYPGAGIYRDVTMTIVNPVHVALYGTKVTMPELASSKGKNGKLNSEVTVQNDSGTTQLYQVRTTLYTLGGDEKSKAETDIFEVGAGKQRKTTVTNEFQNPNLWEIGNGRQYLLRTEILLNNKVVDCYDEKIGYRWTNWNNETGFSLNGKPVKIQGVCLHHDQGALGAVQNKDAIDRQISVLSMMGINAVRTSHNTASKALIEVCNDQGILVMEEFFDGWNEYKNGNTNDFSKYFNQNTNAIDSSITGSINSQNKTWAEFVVKQTVMRDRNDPCVFMWSAGNELNQDARAQVDGNIAARIRTWVHSADESRVLTFGDNTGGSDSLRRQITESMDVIGGNYNQPKWNGPYNKPFIGSETASAVNSRGEYNATGSREGVNYVNESLKSINAYDASAVSWGNTAADAWDKVIKNDWHSGEFVWTGFDYIGEPTPWNNTTGNSGVVPNSSYFGIVDTAGFPKDTYALYKSLWDRFTDSTVHIVPGTWKQSELTIENGFVDVAVYSNFQKIELYLNNELIGSATKQMVSTDAGFTYPVWTEKVENPEKCKINDPLYTGNGAEFYPQFQVKYAPGELTAKAYKEDGTEAKYNRGVFGARTVTDKNAAYLSASAFSHIPSITADGKSLAYIEIEADDENGNFVPSYNGKINVSLTGNGRIVGVDNGNPATTKKFQNSSVLSADKMSGNIELYNGRAVVIVETTETSGEFVLNIVAEDGLPVHGNTPAAFSSDYKADGKFTLETTPETGKALTDEFEEIAPQFFAETYTVEGAKDPDTIRIINSYGHQDDHMTIKYPRNMYLDISETLEGVGYKMTYLGLLDKDTHYGPRGDTDYAIVLFPALWGGPGPYVHDKTFCEIAFTNYGVTENRTEDNDEGWKNYSGNSTYRDVAPYNDIDFFFRGTPKQTGDYTYAANSKGDSLLWMTQYWSWPNWKDQQKMYSRSHASYVKDQNGQQAIIEMTAHIYDKTPIRQGLNLEAVKAYNEPYQQLISGGDWESFLLAYNSIDLAQAKEIMRKREVTQDQITAAATEFENAVEKANALKFKAPQEDLDNLKAKITEAQEILNNPEFEKKYTLESKANFKSVLDSVKASKYVSMNDTPEYQVDAANNDSLNAGYKAHSDKIALQRLLSDLQAAIDSLQVDATKTVNATLFKYGYNTNAQGLEKYAGGGHAMNEIAMQMSRDYLNANSREEIGAILDRVVTVDENSSWNLRYRPGAIDDAVDRYANYYSLMFTGGPVSGKPEIINEWRRTAWNVWCKRGTQAPGEAGEEGASLQGLASPTLTTGASGEKYFTTHAPYTVLPFGNPTDKGDSFRENRSFDFAYGGGIYHTTTQLPDLHNIAVASPDLFKKEALDINGHPTSETNGNFAKYYWDTELPLKTVTRDGVNYFEYDSTSNEYFLQTKFNDADRTAEMSYVQTPDGWSVDGPASGRGFFPFNYQGKSSNFTGENAVYHYGLTFDTDFYIPASGTYDNEEDIVFEFTGDDDVYVYIDDTLVLDNGGLHGARKSSINFTDMSVSYQYVMDVSQGSLKSGPKPVPGSNDIVYTYGKDNGDISADNMAALEKLQEVRNSPDTHTLTFFFLERGSGSSNCDISFNIKAASEEVDLNRQSYVVDFDSTTKMNLKENDVISQRALDTKGFKTEYVGIADLNKYEGIDHDAIEFSDQHTPNLYKSFEGNNKIEFTTANGAYTFTKDGILKFKPSTMIYDSQDLFYAVTKVTNDPTFAEGTVYYRYEPVVVAPSTAVYYEDNSDAIHYTNGRASDNSDNGSWKTIGSKSTQDELILNKAAISKGEGHYGFNEGYNNFNTYSAGAAHNVTVSANNSPNKGGTYPVAEFDFAGTGFDVISATKNTTGTVKVEVKNSETGEVVARKMVDTYYNQQFGQLYQTPEGTVTLTPDNNKAVYFSVNGAYTTNPTHYELVDGVEKIVDGAAQDGQKSAIAYGWLTADNAEGTDTAIYQAPVIKIDNLPYGKYHVKMTVTYTPAYAHGNTDYDFILDAVRVYDPLKPSNQTTNGLYEHQDEGHPIRLELRDKLLGSEAVTTEQNGVLMFKGAPLESKALESFTAGCPNNEVYLTNGTAVGFHLWAKAEPLHAKLGVKLANGANGNVNVTIGDKANNIALNTATDMYYRLENINWTKDGEWYKSELITVENTSAATVSLTNVELTFKADSQAHLNKAEVPEAKLMVTAATPRMFTAVMNRADANLELTLDNVSVKLDDNGKSVVTINLTSTTDVDKIIVKNDKNVVADANISSKVNGSSKTWTVKFIETQTGKHTYTVEAADAGGYNGSEDPLEVTFKAKKAPIGFKAARAVRNFFDKLFGR